MPHAGNVVLQGLHDVFRAHCMLVSLIADAGGTGGGRLCAKHRPRRNNAQLGNLSNTAMGQLDSLCIVDACRLYNAPCINPVHPEAGNVIDAG